MDSPAKPGLTESPERTANKAAKSTTTLPMNSKHIPSHLKIAINTIKITILYHHSYKKLIKLY